MSSAKANVNFRCLSAARRCLGANSRQRNENRVEDAQPALLERGVEFRFAPVVALRKTLLPMLLIFAEKFGDCRVSY